MGLSRTFPLHSNSDWAAHIVLCRCFQRVHQILYGAPVSPFVRKVLAFVAEKGVVVELVPVGLGDQNRGFLACSPFRKMPGFTDEDFSISDLAAILSYIEAEHPEVPLIPTDPTNRVRAVWFDEFANPILTAPAGPIFFNRIVLPKLLAYRATMR